MIRFVLAPVYLLARFALWLGIFIAALYVTGHIFSHLLPFPLWGITAMIVSGLLAKLAL